MIITCMKTYNKVKSIETGTGAVKGNTIRDSQVDIGGYKQEQLPVQYKYVTVGVEGDAHHISTPRLPYTSYQPPAKAARRYQTVA